MAGLAISNQTVSRSARPGRAGQGVQDFIEESSKKNQGFTIRRERGGLRLPSSSCLRRQAYFKRSLPCVRQGALYVLKTIFHGQSDAEDAMKFMNNQDVTMLVTRRKYTNQSTFTAKVVALLAWTGRIKSVVYIGWAAVWGGQSNLPSPLADSTSPAYRLPGEQELSQPVPKGFTRLGLMTVMVDLMEQGTCWYKKLKSPYTCLHLNPTSSPTHISPEPCWTKHGFVAHVDETLVIPPLTPPCGRQPNDVIPTCLKDHGTRRGAGRPSGITRAPITATA
jgi:hypothetical protein